jgi:hypothetical protein
MVIKEQVFHQENKNNQYKYMPKKSFGGWTECYSQIEKEKYENLYHS